MKPMLPFLPLVLMAGSCTSPAPAPRAAAGLSVMATHDTPALPGAGESRRVGGDVSATISGSDGRYVYGPSVIDTPLPEGYPPPTPPGAIDIKTYPSVRRAVVSGKGSPDAGMNQAFWPLFNHIKGHDIAMTSPVEMDYPGLTRESAPSEWSMAFLYRTPELNDTGREGRVIVEDAPPVTVLAVGLKGNYSMSLVTRGMEQIEQFLAENPEWEAAGSWRSLYYNGPALLWWNKWAEVQLPVRPRRSPAGT